MLNPTLDSLCFSIPMLFLGFATNPFLVRTVTREVRFSVRLQQIVRLGLSKKCLKEISPRIVSKEFGKYFVCNRGDTMHYWTRTNYGALLHSSMLTMDNTTQYHGRHPIMVLMQVSDFIFLFWDQCALLISVAWCGSIKAIRSCALLGSLY